jgi:hypothetical protein
LFSEEKREAKQEQTCKAGKGMKDGNEKKKGKGGGGDVFRAVSQVSPGEQYERTNTECPGGNRESGAKAFCNSQIWLGESAFWCRLGAVGCLGQQRQQRQPSPAQGMGSFRWLSGQLNCSSQPEHLPQ